MSGKSRNVMMTGTLNGHEQRPPADGVATTDAEGDACGPGTARPRLLRVLIVDDCRDSADSLAMLVKLWGYRARVAYTGAAALESAFAYRPHILLMDIGMPGMDGYQLALRVAAQARLRNILRVAITGYADKGSRRRWEGAFDHYLVKPVEPSTLEKLLMQEQDRLGNGPDAFHVPKREHGVLVVDDERCVREVLDVGLRQYGFAVRLAASGAQALDLYRGDGQAIDVVLLDVRMPGLDGPQTLAALRQLNPEVRCCFMSGDLGAYTAGDLHSLGAAAVLRKPFRLDDAASVLREVASNAAQKSYTFTDN